eukprot:CAMPEP_0181027046 /NCGR_PEP_ID=MMETSP1070-20121207/3961_1 /TAXON_ID=265543 /ORGANISM="Minutocellus polymorphus, Strain NH13" /LENGTH=523 /DNA_ID=CAMNT_0023104273 /DNA_START=11 /DNA_END=1582 /DNA_ORIENTATION=-
MKTSLVFFALLLSPWQIAAFQLPRPKPRYVANIPEDDGGCTPTKLEQKKIGQVKKNMFVPGVLRNPHLPRWVKRIQRTISRKNNNNDALFRGLDSIRTEGGTPMQRIVDIGKNIDFTNKTQTIMWFEVKPQKIVGEISLAAALTVFEFLPPLLLDVDKELMLEDDYAELIGPYILPYENLMKVGSPIECFLRNSPAFCAPTPDDDTVSVCDMDYLERYQVQKGTKHRYGGVAYVKDGNITKVGDVKRGDDGFELKVNLFLNAFAVHVIVDRHAVMAHLAIYQKYLMSLTTGKSDKYKSTWEKNKSAGLLLKALTPRRTSEVNTNIQLLIGPGNSLVGRATSFTNDALTLLNIEQYDKYFAMSPTEIIHDIGSSGSKGWQDACQHAWDAAQKLVGTICKDMEKDFAEDDTSLRDLAMLLWTGTFYHSFIGDFQLDNVNRGNLPLLLTGEKHRQSVAYGTLSTTIGVSTMTRTMDVMTAGKYLYTDDDRTAWDAYMEELVVAASKTGIDGFTLSNPADSYNAIDF